MAPRVPAGRRGSSRPAAAAATPTLVMALAMALVVGLAACGGPDRAERAEPSAGGPPTTTTTIRPTTTTAPPTTTTVPPTTTTAPPPPTTTTVPPLPVDAEAADPSRVVVPDIGVDAPVIALGLGPDGALQPPPGVVETGWWQGGPEPGEKGPAVIAGHVDSRAGPAVFHRLGELGPGDRIEVVRADGTQAVFAVSHVERHPKAAFPTDAVYGPTDGAALRLVTCGGAFDRSSGHYVDNVIVFADRLPG